MRAAACPTEFPPEGRGGRAASEVGRGCGVGGGHCWLVRLLAPPAANAEASAASRGVVGRGGCVCLSETPVVTNYERSLLFPRSRKLILVLT